MPQNRISQTKSKERIRDLAEVYTNEREVHAMLDLTKDLSQKIESRYLEPACGNGNFLVEILRRKLSTVTQRFKKQQDFEFYTIKALSNIYGIDVCDENIKEAQTRLHAIVLEHYSFWQNTKKPNSGFYKSVDFVLSRNIQVGDTLNLANNIIFTEFSSPKIYHFKMREYLFRDLAYTNNQLFKPRPIKEHSITKYLELYNVG